ncbi:hypothetical protein [Massilia sp. S19_KUP03_FR1]|uniref:hypothetical protein n=1 Tax=Massilia sp. S19_KUP03_FR1 TaxID=3025503 RepID=UPI002FCD399A
MSARTIGADQLFDIFDQNGQALAVGVDAAGAAMKAETLMERLDWTGDIVIRRRRASATPSAAARFWLVHDGLDQFGPVTVHVRSPFGFFGLTLEQALFRIDQFHLQDQHRLRAGIERYFGVGPGQVDQSRHAVAAPTTTPAPARRTTKRTEKESA